MKFGKLPTIRDPRSLKIGSYLHQGAIFAVPDEYDFDTDPLADASGKPVAPILVNPMFANDRFGDCVIAGRGHAQRRMERVQQRIIIEPSEAEVIWEWHNEQGGASDGLCMLDSIKAWRKWGWTAGGRQYKADCWCTVDPCATDHVKSALYLQRQGLAVLTGCQLPYSVTSNTHSTDAWEVESGPWGVEDPNGGHCMLLCSYDASGVTFVTWGRRQRATWAFLEAYCTEAYVIVPALDTFLVGPPRIDVEALRAELARVAA